MRTVTLQLNMALGDLDMNWSVKTEVFVDDDSLAEEAGRLAASFLMHFQTGMTQGFNDYSMAEE